jgi:hypothetical protein
MHKLKLLAAIAPFLCASVFLVGSAEEKPEQFTVIDATNQQSRPPRGRGPFPGSPNPGYTSGLPIRLELLIPSGELRANGTAGVDFVLTNIGTEPLKLPSSPILFNAPMDSLNLWITSDGIKDWFLKDVATGQLVKIEIVPISAELDGVGASTFYILTPNKSIRVHASSPVLIPGVHVFTAHAEFAHISNRTEVIGTADSEAVTTTISTPTPTTR